MARRPGSETILSREQLLEFQRRLSMLSIGGVEGAYRTAYLEGDRFPAPDHATVAGIGRCYGTFRTGSNQRKRKLALWHPHRSNRIRKVWHFHSHSQLALSLANPGARAKKILKLLKAGRKKTAQPERLTSGRRSPDNSSVGRAPSASTGYRAVSTPQNCVWNDVPNV
jgi:hypothetical protein